MTRMGHASAEGFSLIELCIVVVILGILFVMGAALFNNARRNGNEAAAIGAMRAINTAQFAYLNGCGNGHYATSFPILGTKTMKGSGGYISDDLAVSATPMRNDYRFQMTAGQGEPLGIDCMGRPTQTAYYATGVPTVPGTTGTRSFGTNQRGDIWQRSGSVPPSEPFGPPATRAE